MTRSPSYLAHNQFGYCFRMHIPLDLQNCIGKKELRYSLQTRRLGEAKTRARGLAGNIQILFSVLGRRNLRLKKMTPKLVNELIRRYRDQAIKEAQRPVNPYKNDPRSWDHEMRNVDSDDELYGFMHELSTLVDWQKRKAVTGDYTGTDESAEKLCKDKDITFKKDSVEFCELCRGMLNADSEATGITLDFLEKEYPHPTG